MPRKVYEELCRMNQGFDEVRRAASIRPDVDEAAYGVPETYNISGSNNGYEAS